MIIHLISCCSANDYEPKLIVRDYKMDTKTKSAIIVEYKNKSLIIPLSNIAMIEDE